MNLPKGDSPALHAAYVCPGCGSANLSAEHPLDGLRVDCRDCGLDFHPSDATPQNAASGLLCGHWTFFGAPGKKQTARCDLLQGHEGMHKFWTSPTRGESFSWSDLYEVHIGVAKWR